jgi:predicted dienelactone hydrolase
MRRFEALLILANLIAFLNVVFQRFSAVQLFRTIALAALLILVLQLALEGPRWQMTPAYVLTTIILILLLILPVLPLSPEIDRIILIISIIAGVALLSLSVALPIIFPMFHFPEPSGPYAIGTVTYHWVDSSRPELFTPAPDDQRELVAQVWYPADNGHSGRRALYIQDADIITRAIARLMKFPSFLLTHFKYIRTNAVESVPMASDQTRYPVLVYLTGLNGFRSASTFQIEDLVSHGYIVVGIDQPGSAAVVQYPDGRQIPGWSKNEIGPLIMQSIEPQPAAPNLNGESLPDGILPYFAQDVSFTLDQLAAVDADDPQQILVGRLDLERVGIFGISMGGEVAAEACLSDPRLQASLIMDVWIPANVLESSLQQPVLFVTRDADTMRLERKRSGGWTEEEIALTLNTLRALYEGLPGEGYYLQIPKMFHINFTDAPYWSPIMSRLGLTGPIDRQRAFDILNAFSLAFFDQHLKGQPSALLHGALDQFPEVNFESRRT